VTEVLRFLRCPVLRAVRWSAVLRARDDRDRRGAGRAPRPLGVFPCIPRQARFRSMSRSTPAGGIARRSRASRTCPSWPAGRRPRGVARCVAVVAGRWGSGRRSRDRRCGRGARPLPARVAPRWPAGADNRVAGRRHGTSQPTHRRRRRNRSPDQGQRHAVDVDGAKQAAN